MPHLVPVAILQAHDTAEEEEEDEEVKKEGRGGGEGRREGGEEDKEKVEDTATSWSHLSTSCLRDARPTLPPPPPPLHPHLPTSRPFTPARTDSQYTLCNFLLPPGHFLSTTCNVLVLYSVLPSAGAVPALPVIPVYRPHTHTHNHTPRSRSVITNKHTHKKKRVK